MFEKKITKTTNVVLKGLTITDGKIVDEDGMERDLNKLVITAFDENDLFDFSVKATSKDSEIIEE